MTPTQRDWLRSVRRDARTTALALEFGRFDGALDALRERFREDVPLNDTVVEARNMIASLATVENEGLLENSHIQRAALRRLHDVSRLITESLLATTERNPGR